VGKAPHMGPIQEEMRIAAQNFETLSAHGVPYRQEGDEGSCQSCELVSEEF
jgi:hypothetical protein